MVSSVTEMKAARCRNKAKRLSRACGWMAEKAIKRAENKKRITCKHIAIRFTYKKFLYLPDVNKVIYLRRCGGVRSAHLFFLGSNFIFLCFKLIILHYYYTPKTREIKFKPRIKLNYNI